MSEGCNHNAHMYYLLLPNLEERTRFISDLKAQDIYSVFHYIPLHSSPAGRECSRAHGSMALTDDLSDRLVRLPLWIGLEEHLERVIDAVKQVVIHRS